MKPSTRGRQHVIAYRDTYSFAAASSDALAVCR